MHVALQMLSYDFKPAVGDQPVTDKCGVQIVPNEIGHGYALCCAVKKILKGNVDRTAACGDVGQCRLQHPDTEEDLADPVFIPDCVCETERFFAERMGNILKRRILIADIGIKRLAQNEMHAGQGGCGILQHTLHPGKITGGCLLCREGKVCVHIIDAHQQADMRGTQVDYIGLPPGDDLLRGIAGDTLVDKTRHIFKIFCRELCADHFRIAVAENMV